MEMIRLAPVRSYEVRIGISMIRRLSLVTEYTISWIDP